MPTRKRTKAETKATAAPAESTTRKQAEAAVIASGMTCRGPTDQNWSRFQKKAPFAGLKIPKEAKTTDEVLSWLLTEGKLEEARELDRVRRKGCGYNYGELVAKHPFDGEDHTVTCPGCGNVSTYRAPVFPELERT